MQIKKIFLSCIILCITAGFLISGCSKGKSPGSTYGNNNNNNYSNTVSISNFSFVAKAITISKGVTVTWTNNDTSPHTVTADDNSFTSGTLNKGGTYSHTFSDAGTFNYHCNIHTTMTASVTVN